MSLLGACSSEDGRPRGISGDAEPASTAVNIVSCEDGATQDCTIVLGQYGGVTTCYVGTQECADGKWGECQGQIVHAGASAKTTGLALSTPTACLANPCDPSCQNYIEQPEGGLQSEPTGRLVSLGDDEVYHWSTGSASALPVPSSEVCYSANDCGHGGTCEGVATMAACDHDKCVTGTALEGSCDPCVSVVCDHDENCCEVACAEDEVRGPTGMICYAAPTAAQSYGEARAACRDRGPGWDLAVVDSAEEESFLLGMATGAQWLGLDDRATESELRWVDGTPLAIGLPSAGWGEAGNTEENDCVLMDASGVWTIADCAQEAVAICEGPEQAHRTWNSECIELLEVMCGARCEPAEAGAESQCTPWWPGQTDAGCDGYDLVLGIPCDETLPVCNRGNTEVPAGVELAHFEPGAVDPSEYALDPSIGTRCTTTAPIPPGHCVSVTDCPGLTETREVMVNPGGAAAVEECSHMNNRGRYSPGVECQQAPSCYGAVSRQSVTDGAEGGGDGGDGGAGHHDVFFVVDKSVYMGDDGFLGWDQATSAVKAFVRSPEAAGVDVAVEFFPLEMSESKGDGCYPGSAEGPDRCTDALVNCANPMVPFGELSATSGTGDAQETRIVDAIDEVSPRDHPLVPVAFQAALTAMSEHRAEHPEGSASVVLIGAHVACQCRASDEFVIELAAHYYEHWGIRTYVVATHSAENMELLDGIAEAGGTGVARVLTQRDSSAEGRTLLLDIVGDEVSVPVVEGTVIPLECSFELENLEHADPAKGLVESEHADGSREILPSVASAEECDSEAGGWFYDDPDAPQSLSLCPATCASLQAEDGAQVEVQVGCEGALVPELRPSVRTEVYEAQCPERTQVQWGFASYSAQTPSDASITVDVRTAPSQEELDSSDWIALESISREQGNEECRLGDGCFLDLWEALGGIPAVAQGILELRMTLYPSSDQQSPLLEGWRITYSCPDAE